MTTTVQDIEELIKERERKAYERGRNDLKRELAGVLETPTSKPKPKKSSRKLPERKKRKNSWEGMTDEQRLARINAIRKGRGLPPRKSLDD